MGKKKVNRREKETKIPEIVSEELSLQERLILEKKTWKAPKPRAVAKEALKLWMSIPAIFLGDEETMSKLGADEDDVRFIMSITTQKQFAETVGVEEPVISKWKSELLKDNDSFALTKSFMRRLTKNVLGALYRFAIKEGDAARIKLYMQIIESWKESVGVEHSGGIDDLGLSTKERAELDKLLKDNTK